MALTKKILRERKRGIGGSDCAAIMGISKWSTPLDVYLNKIDPDIQEQETNDALEWGNILEPIIRKRYTQETGNKVKTYNNIIKNPKYPWLLANIDGWVLDGEELSNKLLEIKTCGYFSKEWEETGTDNIPPEYIAQCAHYCIVCDAIKHIDGVDVAVFGMGNRSLRTYHYARNDAFEEKVIEFTHKFWHKNVLAKIPPMPLNNNDILSLYEKGNEDNILILPDNMKDDFNKLNSLKRKEKLLKTEIDRIEGSIKGAMKDCAYLCNDENEILATWKNQKCSRFQSSAFKEKHLELYNKFISEKESRVFRIKRVTQKT